MADSATIASLATAGGTLVLAVATFSATRSSNRSARVAEEALQERRRPVLVNARLDDPVQKLNFLGGHWIKVEGSQAVIDLEDNILYLGLALRNVGAGIAILQGWQVHGDAVARDVDHVPVEDFRRQLRDIYIAPGDVGLWQGAMREPDDELRHEIAGARSERRAFSLELLYSDQVGGHRTISRFVVAPAGEERWIGTVGLHWNLDGDSPRFE